MATLTRSAGRALGVAPRRIVRALAIRSGGSPARLRAAAAATVVVALLLAIAGSAAVDRRAGAIDDAARAAEQLIRVQEVRVLVVEADSLASGAYLVGGQEPAEQRAAYDERVDAAASGLVAVAARAEGATREALSRASGALATYVGLVEQARANNRQGFPVGAAYQRQARTVAQDLVAELRAVEQAARDEVGDRMAAAHRASWPLGLTAAAALAALVAGGVWLARRFRRLVNVPLALAAGVALVIGTVGVGTNARAVARADDAVTGALADADVLAQGRAALFDARSNEALTLIARGTGGPYELAWQASDSVVRQAVDALCRDADRCDLREAHDAYRSDHGEVRVLDDGGDWDGAVALAVEGAASASFAEVDAAVRPLLESRTAAALTDLDSANDPLDALRPLVLAGGLVIAVLALAGYGLRLREYR